MVGNYCRRAYVGGFMTEELRHIIATNPKGRIIINLSDEDAYFTAITYKEFQLALERGDEQIITPLTTAIDNYYCCLGYRVLVCSEDQTLCLNDLLLGIKKNDNDKDLRLAHNAEKLILNEVYSLKTKWIKK